MKNNKSFLIIKRIISLLLGCFLLFSIISCSNEKPKEPSGNPPSDTSADMSEEISANILSTIPKEISDNISGSYTVLDFIPKTDRTAVDLSRPLKERVIWEHTILGAVNKQTELYSFDPDHLDKVNKRTLSFDQQTDYAGLRILEDKIMVKSREGYYFMDNQLNLLGKPVSFSASLTKELKKLEQANGSYYNHFDISADGCFVYYTDEREKSLFKYDITEKKKTTLLSEIDIRSSIEPDVKLSYRLYNILLTPNEKFVIAKVAGYMDAYYIFNLEQPDQSILVDALPVHIEWHNVQDVIPMFSDSDAFTNPPPKQFGLVLWDLVSNGKTQHTVPLNLQEIIEGGLYATFNQDFLAYTSYNYDKAIPEPIEEVAAMVQYHYNTRQDSQPVTSKLQLNVVGLLKDGRTLIYFTPMSGNPKGYLLTKQPL